MRKFLGIPVLAAILFLFGGMEHGREQEVVFPAYQDAKNEWNHTVYETEPFVCRLTLPDGWEIRLPEEAERKRDAFIFRTPVLFYEGDEYKGYMGFQIFEHYDDWDLPPEEYWKSVYPDLRLSSMMVWDNYVPVRSGEGQEAATATANYLDPEEIDRHPGAMSEVPWISVPGVLCYDKERQVYVGIQFAEGAATDELAREIAELISVSAPD